MTLWKRITNWLKTLFGIKPAPVCEALPQFIEESDIVKFARKHKRIDLARYAELDQIHGAMKDKNKIIVQTHNSVTMTDHIVTLAAWLSEAVEGISIGIASPNLQMSYRIRAEIDLLTEGRTRKTNNKDTVIFDNNAGIHVTNSQRIRGRKYDVLIVNAAEHIAEPYLTNYMTAFSVIASHGNVIVFTEDIEMLKTTYFPGFARLFLSKYIPTIV